jgi:hypothetical protein
MASQDHLSAPKTLKANESQAKILPRLASAQPGICQLLATGNLDQTIVEQSTPIDKALLHYKHVTPSPTEITSWSQQKRTATLLSDTCVVQRILRMI